MELSFDSGVKEYTIRGVNGVVTVYFNPADVNFAKKAYRVFNDLRKKQEERAAKLDVTEPGDELFDSVACFIPLNLAKETLVEEMTVSLPETCSE